MSVEILLYSAILFTSKFTNHIIAAKCPYDVIPGIFEQRGNPFYGERGEKEILVFRKPIRFWASLNFNHTKNNI